MDQARAGETLEQIRACSEVIMLERRGRRRGAITRELKRIVLPGASLLPTAMTNAQNEGKTEKLGEYPSSNKFYFS